jgi:hypothetical protein
MEGYHFGTQLRAKCPSKPHLTHLRESSYASGLRISLALDERIQILLAIGFGFTWILVLGFLVARCIAVVGKNRTAHLQLRVKALELQFKHSRRLDSSEEEPIIMQGATRWFPSV